MAVISTDHIPPPFLVKLAYDRWFRAIDGLTDRRLAERFVERVIDRCVLKGKYREASRLASLLSRESLRRKNR